MTEVRVCAVCGNVPVLFLAAGKGFCKAHHDDAKTVAAFGQRRWFQSAKKKWDVVDDYQRERDRRPRRKKRRKDVQ